MPNSTPLDIGDVATVTSTFTNAAGAPTNPTVVTLRIKKPTGTVTVVNQASLTNTSAGVWTYDVAIDTAGIWWYRFEGTGAVAAAEEDYLFVRNRRVPVA